MLSSMSTRSYAATTDELLNACDKALTAKRKEADLCDYGIKLRDDARMLDQKEIADLRAARSAWYNNSFLWLAVGILAGGYLGIKAAK